MVVLKFVTGCLFWIHRVSFIASVQSFPADAASQDTADIMREIIDAMDLLYSGNVDAFALMTSDSDFTPLVLRILEAGFPVYGFGQEKTPAAFVDACSPFIFIENLLASSETETSDGKTQARWTRGRLRKNRTLVRLLRTAIDQAADDDGWANMGQVASYISNNNSSFSPVNYGYKRISDLIKASDLFEIEMRNGTAMYLRDPKRS